MRVYTYQGCIRYGFGFNRCLEYNIVNKYIFSFFSSMFFKLFIALIPFSTEFLNIGRSNPPSTHFDYIEEDSSFAFSRQLSSHSQSSFRCFCRLLKYSSIISKSCSMCVSGSIGRYTLKSSIIYDLTRYTRSYALSKSRLIRGVCAIPICICMQIVAIMGETVTNLSIFITRSSS